MVPRFAGVVIALAAAATASLPAQEQLQSDSGSRQGTTVIRMGALGGLRYEFSKFFVPPRAAVELILENRDEMMHNLVITKPGARMKVVMQAVQLGADAAKVHYIPKTPEVLWSIDVVKPGTAKTLRFAAPETPGDYPYVCTYPGHGFVMFGTMVVRPGKQPPPVKSVLGGNIPDLAHGAAAMKGMAHGTPGLDAAPRVRLRRMILPFTGPASIAVTHPGDLSYCFDAGACRLRYVWAGGPIEKIALKTAPSLTGPILHREPDGFPLHFGAQPGDAARQVRFLGYRLDGAGIPEFEYRVDGIVVHERIVPHKNHVERRWRCGAAVEQLWVAFAGKTPPSSVPTGRLRLGRDGAPSHLGFTLAENQTLTMTFQYTGKGAPR